MDERPLLIVDLEATCWENRKAPAGETQSIQNMEIIEFGCALATQAGELLDSQSFLVRPVQNPQLCEFCSSLASIRQSMVEAAPPYLEPCRMLDAWLGQLLWTPESRH